MGALSIRKRIISIDIFLELMPVYNACLPLTTLTSLNTPPNQRRYLGFCNL